MAMIANIIQDLKMPGTELSALCISWFTLQSNLEGEYHCSPQLTDEETKAEVIKLGPKLLRRAGLEGSVIPYFATPASFSAGEDTARPCTHCVFCPGLIFLLICPIEKASLHSSRLSRPNIPSSGCHSWNPQGRVSGFLLGAPIPLAQTHNAHCSVVPPPAHSLCAWSVQNP